MSITKLQSKSITIGTPVEIDSAVNELRLLISDLPWISHPYFIAKRFVEIDAKGNKKFVYPETYCKNEDDPSLKYPYHPVKPDNDYTGMVFQYVGKGTPQTQDISRNKISYNVAFIFSVNLALINKPKLDQGIFTRELMRDVRNLLFANKFNFDFDYNILSETDDLQEVYREFKLDELQKYNRAPLQCFRFDTEIIIEEDCI